MCCQTEQAQLHASGAVIVTRKCVTDSGNVEKIGARWVADECSWKGREMGAERGPEKRLA